MAQAVAEEELQAIETIVRRYPDGVTASAIARALKTKTPRRTLQYRLRLLVNEGRLARRGERRWATYVTPKTDGAAKARAMRNQRLAADVTIPLSKNGLQIQKEVRKPLSARKPVGYRREFLDKYRPNVSAYLSAKERAHLKKVGTPGSGNLPAGTYAKQILNRLLIDLAWNSSRLEGNTYSLLDTKRLIAFGEEAEGKEKLEAQMILNHKDAIEFLVGSAEDVGFNRHTILNLHALLANNLLADPTAPGRLRRIAVGIEKSTFHPLEIPQLIEECFDQILATAAAIEDPFEQSFFVMVQLPYLQPFDDVNKRVSRLSANIPMIKGNFSPLSFTDVPVATYTNAILGVYELNKTDLLKDMYIWAYERSAARYAAVRQSLGEPDPFRLKHREALRELVSDVILRQMNRKAAAKHIAAWAHANLGTAEHSKFQEMVEDELLALHEGNFARYRIRPSEFKAWKEVWESPNAEAPKARAVPVRA